MKRVIVGIDPGTTVGIAILSFSNQPILIFSKRGLSDEEIEQIILSKGKPVILATDVPKVPAKVERLARQLGAIVFSPPREIPEKEKDRIMKLYGVKVDDHARDALAAAHLAYLHYRPLIERVLRRLREEEFVEELIEKVVRGGQIARTVREAFRERVETERKREKRRKEEKELIQLRKKVGELVREKKELLKKLEEREKKRRVSGSSIVSELEAEIFKLKREKEDLFERIRRVEREKASLEAKIKALETLLKKIEESVRKGRVLGPKELVEGEEILPGVYMGRLRRSLKERISEIVEEYRRRRRKELNLL